MGNCIFIDHRCAELSSRQFGFDIISSTLLLSSLVDELDWLDKINANVKHSSLYSLLLLFQILHLEFRETWLFYQTGYRRKRNIMQRNGHAVGYDGTQFTDDIQKNWPNACQWCDGWIWGAFLVRHFNRVTFTHVCNSTPRWSSSTVLNITFYRCRFFERRRSRHLFSIFFLRRSRDGGETVRADYCCWV